MAFEYFDNMLGLVGEQNLLTTGFNVTRPNDPIDGLFDDQLTDNIAAKWHYIANEYQIPQMAQFHAFDVQAKQSIRMPIDQKSVEKGLIKVKRPMTELLYTLQNKGVNQERELFEYALNDINELADEVITRTKVAKNELLATGKVTIKENNLDITIDYGVPSDNLGLTLDVGAGASADVPTQLQDIVDRAAESGVAITGMVLARKVLSKLRANAAIQKAINGVNATGVLVSNAALLAYLDAEFGISRVITNDLTYSMPWTVGSDGRPVTHKERYFPAEKVSFFGTGNGMKLGSGLWGIPPEEQIARFGNVSTSAENPFVYVHQWVEDDPAVVWTKATGLFMPVLYSPDSLYVASVAETPGA